MMYIDMTTLVIVGLLAFALGAGTIGIILQIQYEEKVEQLYDRLSKKEDLGT